ncbi:MAG: transcriptional regulator [Polyangiaceae bacterium]|nr:transcriptional regulator [Polyangiaceae bacterium]
MGSDERDSRESGATLDALVAAGRAAWPSLALDEAAFAAELRRRLDAADDRAGAVARLRPDDLYLACACAKGDARAIEAFERKFANVIDRAVSRFARTPERRDELRQILRDRLFVAVPGAEPRIATYSGQGFLENWLRVAAVRAFVNAERGKKIATARDDETLSSLADGHDLELDFLKVHYRSSFRAAFASAIKGLSSSDRLILRLSVLQNLSCDDLAVTLGVHRATAARRVARAKQLLVEGTRKELATSLRVDEGELASILKLVEDNLDLSLSRLLAPTEASIGDLGDSR